MAPSYSICVGNHDWKYKEVLWESSEGTFLRKYKACRNCRKIIYLS